MIFVGGERGETNLGGGLLEVVRKGFGGSGRAWGGPGNVSRLFGQIPIFDFSCCFHGALSKSKSNLSQAARRLLRRGYL